MVLWAPTPSHTDSSLEPAFALMCLSCPFIWDVPKNENLASSKPSFFRNTPPPKNGMFVESLTLHRKRAGHFQHTQIVRTMIYGTLVGTNYSTGLWRNIKFSKCENRVWPYVNNMQRQRTTPILCVSFRSLLRNLLKTGLHVTCCGICFILFFSASTWRDAKCNVMFEMQIIQ